MVTQSRIVVLWALSETMLGGLLHALHLPVTGFLVGGFSVLCIGMLAHGCARTGADTWRTITMATSVVLLAKALMSPQSPPTAYLAVAFQGVVGALSFRWLPYRIAAPLFGFLALAESGAQRVLVLSLFFGKAIWEAIGQFAAQIAQSWGLDIQISAFSVVLGYALFHGIWGLVLGIWLWYLPHQLASRKYLLHPLYLEYAMEQDACGKSSSYLRHWFSLFFVLAFVAMLLWYLGGVQTLVVALRAVVVLLVLFLAVLPVFQRLVARWAKRSGTRSRAYIHEVIAEVTTAQRVMRGIWYATGQQGWSTLFRLREAVIGLFAWASVPVSHIVILTGAVRSYKSTTLMHWARGKTHIHGFITPDHEDSGLRIFQTLPEGHTYPFESQTQDTNTISVGRFHFYTAAFERGRSLLNAYRYDPSAGWLVVDEIGKLELIGSGFEPALSACIAAYQSDDLHGYLLLVVRDTLLREVLDTYKITDPWIITIQDLRMQVVA